MSYVSYVIVFDLISQCTRARLTRLYQPQCSNNEADHCIVDVLVRIVDDVVANTQNTHHAASAEKQRHH